MKGALGLSIVAWCLGVAVLAVGCVTLHGCGASAATTAAQQSEAASYGAELHACVQRAQLDEHPRDYYTACRARVNAEHGVDAAPPAFDDETDGGAP